MARLPGDPGPLSWLKFAVGFRLPDDYADWVRHELTDAGWRTRTVVRHLAVIVPICAVLAALLLTLLPAPAWLAGMMIGLILAGSTFTVAAYADDIRASRMRQHGLEAPDDPDLGRPAHLAEPGRPVTRASGTRQLAGRISCRAASVTLPDSDG